MATSNYGDRHCPAARVLIWNLTAFQPQFIGRKHILSEA